MTGNDRERVQTEERYTETDLISFATQLLQGVGLARDRAKVVAEVLLEADLMGHTTHGLQLLSAYLQELEAGSMTREGDPEMIADKDVAITWDRSLLTRSLVGISGDEFSL